MYGHFKGPSAEKIAIFDPEVQNYSQEFANDLMEGYCK